MSSYYGHNHGHIFKSPESWTGSSVTIKDEVIAGQPTYPSALTWSAPYVFHGQNPPNAHVAPPPPPRDFTFRRDPRRIVQAPYQPYWEPQLREEEHRSMRNEIHDLHDEVHYLKRKLSHTRAQLTDVMHNKPHVENARPVPTEPKSMKTALESVRKLRKQVEEGAEINLRCQVEIELLKQESAISAIDADRIRKGLTARRPIDMTTSSKRFHLMKSAAKAAAADVIKDHQAGRGGDIKSEASGTSGKRKFDESSGPDGRGPAKRQRPEMSGIILEAGDIVKHFMGWNQKH